MSGHPMSGLFVNVLTAYIAMLISFDEGGHYHERGQWTGLCPS